MNNVNIKVMTSSKNMEWATPQEFVDSTPFNYGLDVCASALNAKAAAYYDVSDDALTKPWRGVCWMNPPYGRAVGRWIAKAAEESEQGALVVALVPNRTETQWFQRIWDEATCICFLAHRIKFVKPGGVGADVAPFANVLATFGRLERNHLRPRILGRYEEDVSPAEIAATELNVLGTTLVPGAGNLWVYGR